MVLCLDIETERLAHEVGGWDHMLKLGVACAAVYDDATDAMRVFADAHGADGEPLDALHALMAEAARERVPVVGHNIQRFGLTRLRRARPLSTCFASLDSTCPSWTAPSGTAASSPPASRSVCAPWTPSPTSRRRRGAA